jgi:exosortase/archaeosortase
VTYGGDSGNRIFVLYWRCPLIRVSVIRGSTVHTLPVLFVLGNQPSHYGYQRLWGTVGWGIFAIISGLLVDEFSKGQTQKDYTVVFYLMLIMLIFDVIVSSRLKVSGRFSFRFGM